jgi:RNA polymerase sigma factor (sigma-70 family)
MAGTSAGALMRRDLVERARRGDREAFAQLATDDVDRLHAVATLVLRDPDLAQDAVQETLIRSWRQLPSLRDVDRYDAWVYRILLRTTADEHHRRSRYEASVRVVNLEPPASHDEAVVEDRDELERGFRRLSIDHRAVIVLHQYVGLPMPEVAQALGIRLGTAKSRYHHAIAALRAALDAEARLERRREVTV